MEKLSEETTRRIQELQMFEQNLQNIIMQKQAFQMEFNETALALEELKTADKEVFKIIGSIMIKTSKDSLEKDLKSKKDILELRLKNLEKQESTFKEKSEKMRDDILKEIK